MTVEHFDELVKKDREQRERLNAEISALMEREAALDSEMTAAANSGDETLFKSLKAEKQSVTDSIFVKRSFRDKLTATVTADDARAAWADFVKGYDKRMSAALAEFAAAKERLLRLYSEAVDLQKHACAVRERLSEATGAPVSSFSMVTIPVQKGANTRGSLRLGNITIVDPDAVYYLSNHVQKTGVQLVYLDGSTPIDPEYARLKTVVENCKSKDSYIHYQ